MTDEQYQVIQSLRDEGYAVTVFTPEELANTDSGECEDLMVERGWDYIHHNKDEGE
ncbi:hypothetical protein [uncultured Marinobacter sp.]|uniref:hypothetical protein n=1 Tax=uncultured Marinobacter sp. TaxID=187379 RepID=UPI002597EC63|nr:hypothetical protein [uncultured Marinobacter sp.]